MDTTETLRVTTPSATEIVMTRTFDAPRQLVFDAFTRPELLRRWLGRQGDEMTVCDVDLRVGGAYRYVWRLRADEHGRRDEMGMGGMFREIGTFHEVDPPERIVCTESFDDYPGEALISTTFVEQDGRTTMTATCAYESQEVRDAVIASGVVSVRWTGVDGHSTMGLVGAFFGTCRPTKQASSPSDSGHEPVSGMTANNDNNILTNDKSCVTV